jgi:methyl-accepting chemotaxis protein
MKFELTFKQKIRVVATLFALDSLALAGVGFYAQIAQFRCTANLEQALSAVQVHTEADMLHEGLRGDVYRALWSASQAPGRLPAITAEITAAGVRLQALERSAAAVALPESTRSAIEAGMPDIAAYVEAARRAATLAAGDPDAAGRAAGEIDTRFAALESRFADLTARLAAYGREAAVTAHTTERRSRTLLGAVLAVAFVLALCAAALLHRQVYLPLERVAVHLQNIADGKSDLTLRLDDAGRDEIAWIAGSFNRFVRKIRKAMQAVATSTAALAEASAELSAMSARARGEVLQQRAEIEHVAHAVGQMAEASTHVADNANVTADAVAQTNGQAVSVRGTVTDVVHTFAAMASEITSATEVIRRLESDCTSIGSVLGVIRGIADQTNLLALNAAIEAARAGEMGRGFAVVADEVRTLASRTQKATLEIQDTMESLQRDAHAAAEVIQTSQVRAAETLNKAGSASDALVDITNRVATLAAMNTETASAAEEQSRAAEEIHRHIGEIREMTSRTAEEADYTAASAGRLATLAAELTGAVSQFKLA